jgi:hypothetical protein
VQNAHGSGRVVMEIMFEARRWSVLEEQATTIALGL